jgi:hypothetical protein
MKELLDNKYDDLILRIINGSYGHSDLPLVKKIYSILDSDRQKELILHIINYTELHFAYAIICLTHDKSEAVNILKDTLDNDKADRLLKLFL